MEMNITSVPLDAVFPILCIQDSVVVSKRGEITLGWKVTLPPLCSLTEQDHLERLDAWSSAVQSLGPNMIVHRQDWFTKDVYSEDLGYSFLGCSYERHFDGREHLVHEQYIFITLALKESTSRRISSSGFFEFISPKKEHLARDLAKLESKGSQFESILTGRGKVTLARLEDTDLIRITSRLLNLADKDGIYCDPRLSGDKMDFNGKSLWAYSIGESSCLPSLISPSQKAELLSSSGTSIHLSTASAIGPLLDCEHIVNTSIFTINQSESSREIDGRKRRMTSMSKNAENKIGAEELDEFLDQSHKEQLVTVKTNTNILLWGYADQEQEFRGKISSALSGMGITCVQATFDAPIFWYSSFPGAAGEISSDNLRKGELKESLCLGIGESFEQDMPGGLLKMCDRFRNIPIRIDIQEAAYKAGLIDNYNAFILGGSGTGKSFFTNYFVRSCYDAGQTVFIIDVGDSYQGLCSIINEESDGRDGVYYTWDRNSPITFDAFVGIDEWVDGIGRLQQEHDGLSFLLSFLQTLWAPAGGWNADSSNILKQIVLDFTISRSGYKQRPIFDDLRSFIVSTVTPAIHSSKGYRCGDVYVSKSRFDIDGLVLAMGDYAEGGAFGFLLNDRNPRDLFSSRFTVFEVDKLSGINDSKFYSLCILCIMNAFNAKMRNTSGMKVMVIEEAWKAIANETMSGYLAGLWKTARKFQTSAVVVTQQISDIMSSRVIKDTILQNSSVRILLDQSNNRNCFSQLQGLLGLTDHQKDLILSMNRSRKNRYSYKEVFIALGDKKYGVYATEVSPEEAIAYESNKEKKQPFLDRCEFAGPIGAIRMLKDGF